jgi:hypothetical protein
VIAPDSIVLVYLREPKERVWGILRRLDAVGVTVEGFDVDGFDAWLRAVVAGADGGEQMSEIFFPMPRVERILLDRPSAGVPALAERFAERMGLSVLDYLGRQREEV